MNIAIVGATGNVGRKILEVLEKKELSIDNLYLLASSRSAGSKINFNGKEYEVIDLETFDFSKVKITFFSAEKKVIFTFEKSKVSRSITSYSFPLKLILDPALLDEASKYKLSIESSFFSRTSNIFLPTLPVAPTIAIFMILLKFILNERQIANVSVADITVYLSFYALRYFPMRFFHHGYSYNFSKMRGITS